MGTLAIQNNKALGYPVSCYLVSYLVRYIFVSANKDFSLRLYATVLQLKIKVLPLATQTLEH